jgi:hypothetical protein
LGLSPTIAYVAGDDLLPRLDELVAAGVDLAHLETGEPVGDTSRFISANAYLGCWGIVEALRRGADIVGTQGSLDSHPRGTCAWIRRRPEGQQNGGGRIGDVELHGRLRRWPECCPAMLRGGARDIRLSIIDKETEPPERRDHGARIHSLPPSVRIRVDVTGVSAKIPLDCQRRRNQDADLPPFLPDSPDLRRLFTGRAGEDPDQSQHSAGTAADGDRGLLRRGAALTGSLNDLPSSVAKYN